MITVKYISACSDSSGYAAASRGYISALDQIPEIDLQLQVVSFEKDKTSHGKFEDTLRKQRSLTPPTVQIVHLTPDNFPTYWNPKLYNIGYCTWEADRIPDAWVGFCNRMQELWVPSAWNVEVFRNSGVTCPIICVPHIIEPLDLSSATNIEMFPPDCFVFYTICQWIIRKNPISLLKAYLTEFKPGENVFLLLKSYRLDTSPREQQLLKNDILLTKKALHMESHEFPPIAFLGNLEPNEVMMGIHKRGDCFVLPCKAEGFGIPLASSMSIGKPVISSRYGGALQFLNNDNSLLVSGFETPCSDMIFGHYHGRMNWFEPSISELKKKMRWVFEHREEAKQIGERGRQTVLTQLNSSVIGGVMLERIRNARNH